MDQPAERGVLAVLRNFLGEDGFVHPSLRLADAGARGRGIFTTTHLLRGEPLVQLPLRRLLRSRKLAWSELLVFQGQGIKGLNEDEELIVYLAALRKHGLYSRWYDYVRSLPYSEPNSSLTWNPLVLRVLRGTPAHKPARTLRKQLLALCHRFAAFFECRELRWAAAHYWSRSFALTLPPAGKRKKPRAFHALLPMVDLFNYDATSPNHFRTLGNSIVYLAGRDYAEGEEVCDAYGTDKNDTFLLVHYGFLQDQEEDSYANIKLATPQKEYRKLKRQILKTQRAEAKQLRVRTNDIEGVNLLRLALMAPDEMSAHNVHSILARAPLPVTRIQRTETLTMQWLSDKCRQQLFDVRKHEEALNATNCKGGQFWLALEYRRRTLQLWEHCLETTERRLQQLQVLLPSRFHDVSKQSKPWQAAKMFPLKSTSAVVTARDSKLHSCRGSVRTARLQFYPELPAHWKPAELASIIHPWRWWIKKDCRNYVQAAGTEFMWRMTAPSWFGNLVHAVMVEPSSASVDEVFHATISQSVKEISICCAALDPFSPLPCDLSAFAWLGNLRGPPAVVALLALPRHLRALTRILDPVRSAQSTCPHD